MSDDPSSGRSPRDSALSASLNALEPIVEMLLDVGVSSHELTHLVRWAYVRQAAARLQTPRRRASTSRLAAATGLTRADVRQLLKESPLTPRTSKWAPRASETVLAGWTTDPDFLDANGKPKPLPYGDTGPGFSELVRRYARDIPPRAMLNELLDSRMAREADEGVGLYVAAVPAPRVSQSQREALEGFGMKMGSLGATLVRNMRRPDAQPIFETILLAHPTAGHTRARVARDLERRCRTFSQAVERFLLDQSSAPATPMVEEQVEAHVGVIIALVETDSTTKTERPARANDHES